MVIADVLERVGDALDEIGFSDRDHGFARSGGWAVFMGFGAAFQAAAPARPFPSLW
jgi:hypothetical protein